MILQKLVEYYRRKAADPDSDIAPQGFEDKEISFIIQVNLDGQFLQIKDTREKIKGNKLHGKRFRVPQSVNRSSNQLPNFLWDNQEFVLGMPIEGKTTTKEKLNKKHQAFLKNLKTLYPHLLDNSEIQAIIRFLESDFIVELQKDPLWNELLKKAQNLSFEVIGGFEGIICQHPDVITAIESKSSTEGGICLVTGENSPIARIHHAVKGVQGSESMGAKFVCFNFDAAESFQKTQGENAPIGEFASFAYTMALNSLLKSSQKISYGEAITVVFWAAKNNHPFESLLSQLIETAPKDDPDRLTNAVKSLYDSPFRGTYIPDDDGTQFHLLGLSPNASRLAINFFWTSTVSEISYNMKLHFSDLLIVGYKEYFSIYEIISSLVVEGDLKKLPPNIMVGYLKAIIEGRMYPFQLLSMALQRLKDKEGISQRRAALIKSWLNRYIRKFQRHEKEVLVSLDQSNDNIGYLLGRLFSILEKIQEEAHGKATIRDRFYSSASARPVTAFPQLMRLKNHHLSKLENKGRVINFEKKISEVMDAISTLPTNLALVDQGFFAIGYYHQRQDFFNKQDKN